MRDAEEEQCSWPSVRGQIFLCIRRHEPTTWRGRPGLASSWRSGRVPAGARWRRRACGVLRATECAPHPHQDASHGGCMGTGKNRGGTRTAWYYGQGVVGNGDVHATTSCMVVLVGLVSGGLACYWWREEGWRVEGGRRWMWQARHGRVGRSCLMQSQRRRALPKRLENCLPADLPARIIRRPPGTSNSKRTHTLSRYAPRSLVRVGCIVTQLVQARRARAQDHHPLQPTGRSLGRRGT